MEFNYCKELDKLRTPVFDKNINDIDMMIGREDIMVEIHENKFRKWKYNWEHYIIGI